MDIKIKSSLPENAQRLVNKIENYANLEILTEAITPSPDVIQPMEITITNQKALLKYDSREFIDPHAVVHELLQLERIWIEQIPEFAPKDEQNRSITSNIDNQYEHLFIIPKEQAYGFEPFLVWEGKFETEVLRPLSINENKKVLKREDIGIKVALLFGKIRCDLFSFNKKTTEETTRIINENSLYEEIIKYSELIQSNIYDKIKCINFILEFLQIPKEKTLFEKILIKERKSFKFDNV